jgi:predicted lipid-binding transport protein (Tim44 family)
MKRQLAAFTIALMFGTTTAGLLVLSTPVLTGDTAWARAGGGSSGGSRGSRGFSAPSRPSSPSSPSRATAPQPAPGSTMPQRTGWGAGLMGGLGGLLLGGLIGSMLFGGLGHGFGGGVGLIELLLLGALAYFAFSFLRRRREAAPAVTGGYGMSAPGGGQTWQPDSTARSVATVEPPAAPSDLDVGLGHIRQMDAGFDPARMTAAAADIFFKLQAAWMARDMSAARDSLTPEMYERMQGQCADLRAQRRINRLENIAVRSTEVTEAWQERGQDFVTVVFTANVLDYTTDEAGQLVDGSRTEPVKFEEFWTFVRPVGPGAWRLTAIQQP